MVEISNVKTNSVQVPLTKPVQKTFVPEQKENKHTTTKVILGGLTALASIGLATIMLKKSPSKVAVNVPEEPIQYALHQLYAGNKTAQEFKKMGGKFIKGKAIFNDKPFTGRFRLGEHGGYIEYNNGVLQKSFRPYAIGAGKREGVTKIYNKDGRLMSMDCFGETGVEVFCGPGYRTRIRYDKTKGINIIEETTTINKLTGKITKRNACGDIISEVKFQPKVKIIEPGHTIKPLYEND